MHKIYAESYDISSNLSTARFKDVGAVVSLILTNAMVLAGLLAFIFIVLAGFAIISGAGSGDPKKMEQGKKTLTMAVVGLLVVVFSLWIIQGLSILLGFNILKPPGI